MHISSKLGNAFILFCLVTMDCTHVATAAISPGSIDTDGDGISDYQDNCIEAANPSQIDSDGDGFGNHCDADLDNSGGLVDAIDYLIFRRSFGTNNAVADFDGNGLVNTTDNVIFQLLFGKTPGPSGLPTDLDGDAVPDELDNCVLLANANQLDSDDDGYGNRCDADLDNSGGLVNPIDLLLFRQVFATVNAAADFNGSGGPVNLFDEYIIKQLYGNTPGPSGVVR